MLNKYLYQHRPPSLVNVINQFPSCYFKYISLLLFQGLKFNTHIYDTLQKYHSWWVCVRWWDYQVELEELQNLSPSKPQFHIQKTGDKTGSSQYLNVPHSSESSHCIKHWLMHASLTNCSLLKYSYLLNTKEPVLTHYGESFVGHSVLNHWVL